MKTQQLKRKRYEEAARIESTFKRIFPPEEIRPDVYESMRIPVDAPPTNFPISSSPLLHEDTDQGTFEEEARNESTFERMIFSPQGPPQDIMPDIYGAIRTLANARPSPIVPHSISPPDEDPNLGFGVARPDFKKVGKRFEWTSQEIEHLQYYILNIEPTLTETEKSNKYASCLSYLRSADAEVKKDFHPHHGVNSGRIKTGYEVAVERFRHTLN